MDATKFIFGCSCLFLAFVAWLIIATIGVHFVKGTLVSATVVDRVYTPSSTSTGFDSHGKVISTSHSEKYTVIVEMSTDASVRSVSANATSWAHAHAGKPVTVLVRRFLLITDYSLVDTPNIEKR